MSSRSAPEPLPPTAQPKLTLSQPGDPLEREADRIAERVVRTSATIQRCQGGCDCDEHVQRRPAGGGSRGRVTTELAAGVRDLAGGGVPLSDAVRQDLEPRFGHDFGAVRVHAGPAAGRLAREASARAFTVGAHIVFADDEFASGTADGRRLLAHELAHVVQQGAAPAATCFEPVDAAPGEESHDE